MTGTPRVAGPGRFRADLVYLGWLPDAEPAPGLPPAPPEPPTPDEVSQEWLAALHREHARLARPARLTGTLGLAAGAVVVGTWLAGELPAGPALLAGAAAVTAAGTGGSGLWRGRRTRAGELRAEHERVAGFRDAQRAELAAQRTEHARQVRSWRQRASAFARRPHWHPAVLPVSVARVDVAGGTLAGWSGLLTTLVIARLAAGGEVTIIDLTGTAVAADLLAAAQNLGVAPLVWVLPADLPQLDLGAGFGPELLADVLARTAAAAGPGQPSGTGHEQARDAALLARVLEALGDDATLAQLTAALRALGQIGAAADHLGSGELSAGQLARLGTFVGRAAGQAVVDRACALEARLRALSPLATGLVSQPASALRVARLDDGAAPLSAGSLAAYLVIALAETLRQSAPARPWQQAVIVLGAERLPAEVLDRLCDTAESAKAGLVLGYRSIPAHVRDRLGRGNAAVAFMRLGNAGDARHAAEQIGSEHRFVISQLTQTVGTSVSDTAGGSSTSTAGTTDSVADSRSVTHTAGRSRGRGRSGSGGFASFAAVGSASRDASVSAGLSDSVSVSAGINANTSWGISTSRALGSSDSVAMAAQRVREFVVEPRELQQLPHGAVVLCYPGPAGRPVVLADANPAIMTLPTATLNADHLVHDRGCGSGVAIATPDQHP